MTDKIRLGWLSDNPCTSTGFSTISKDLLNRLNMMPDFDCKFLAHNYLGLPLARNTKFLDGTELNFELHGCGREQYCKDIMSWWIKEHKLDVFGVLLDSFMLHGGSAWFLNVDTSPSRTIFYFPSDGGARLPLDCDRILRRVSMPVAMSKFAQRQAWKVHGIKAEYIPHAVDLKLYYRYSEEQREALKEKWGLKNKWICGTVARNQGRKMMDRTVKAFALFAKGKDDVVLLMHTDPQDCSAVFDITELVQRYNIQNKVLFTGTRYFKGFTYQQMRDVYNLMDVFFLSTSGEGWGIPLIEAAACGVPLVDTDCTTCQEILVEDGQCGLPVKCLCSPGLEEVDSITGTWSVERFLMSCQDGADKLQKLYDDRQLGRRLGEEGVRKVAKLYDWDKVAGDWACLIRRLVEK